MKKNILLFLFLFIFNFSFGQEEIKKENEQSLKINTNHRKKFLFNFTDKPLVELINELAAEKKVNIVLPQGALAIQPTTKVTMHFQNPMNMKDAWKQLMAILELAGYTIEPAANMLHVKKIDQNINREPLDVYIDIPFNELPDTAQVIRALFYLKNLSLKANWNDLNAMLKDMLSQTADIRADIKTNSIILTDKANNIKGVMKIINELDKGGMKDSIQVLPLYYVSAQVIDDLFNKQMLAPKQQPTAGAPAVSDQASYFPKNTRVLGIEHTNSLVIMGSPYAIDAVKDFIFKYIDRPLESGESILHVYELQYLNAQEFAPILQQMVSPAQEGQAAGRVETGPKQYFKDVRVTAEITRETMERIMPTTPGGQAVTGAPQPITEGARLGGNRLIIAARKKDWLRIKKLIEDLDKPQPQVALEVLVVDVILDNNRLLGHQMRDTKGFDHSISDNLHFQVAGLNQPILSEAFQDDGLLPAGSLPANALMSNLLRPGSLGNSSEGVPQNLANVATPGSLIISLDDANSNGVWSVWQILNRYMNTTILAQPFIITKNHKQATVTITQQRLLEGDADTSNVAVKVNFQWVTAALTVDILPHISSSNNVNLQITINVNEFASETQNNRITRLIQTNANIGDKQILAIGGLTRTQESISTDETPLLGKIPILGWFFKREVKNKEKNNLVIFISPTIIEPKLKGGTDMYTDRKLDLAKDNLNEYLNFENLKDPITRWFFKPDVCLGEKTIAKYRETTLQEFDQNEMMMARNNTEMAPKNSFNLADQSKETNELKKLIEHEENPLLTQANPAQADPQS
ncbi:MAG: secretin N-terminal domain-containing protein [Candidatus Babeliales bacterium]